MMTRSVTRDGQVLQLNREYGSSRLIGHVAKVGKLWSATYPGGYVHPALFHTRTRAIDALERRQKLVDEGLAS